MELWKYVSVAYSSCGLLVIFNEQCMAKSDHPEDLRVNTDWVWRLFYLTESGQALYLL